MKFLEETTVFHVTHYKAGSRWLFRILKRCVRDRLLQVSADRKELLDEPIQAGRVYSACYVTKDQFEGLELPPDSRHFLVLRDLRDTLVSGYFSLKISHPEYKLDAVNAMRNRLRNLDQEEGLMHTLTDWVPANAEIQQSWVESGQQFVRFEDLLADDEEILETVLLEQCELGVSKRALRRAVANESFERLSGGRARGEEDTTAHYRKGIAGDWRNYFSEALKDAFKERYGDLLIRAGYEQDNNW